MLWSIKHTIQSNFPRFRCIGAHLSIFRQFLEFSRAGSEFHGIKKTVWSGTFNFTRTKYTSLQNWISQYPKPQQRKSYLDIKTNAKRKYKNETTNKLTNRQRVPQQYDISIIKEIEIQ